MTLLDCYNEIMNNTKLWQYYSQMPDIGDLQFTESYCRRFINTYLQTGLKCRIPSKMPKCRVLHTVSVFFLGLFLYYKVFDYISTRDIERSSFIYYWFLTCFYHDCGYVFECRSRKWSMTDKSLMDKLEAILPSLPSSLDFLRDSHLVYNYFLYRKKKDHGIGGAIKMFNDSQNNHDNLVSKMQADYSSEDHASFIFPGTNIHLNQAGFYLPAATIAIHNIWMGNENDEERYREACLEPLINRKFVFCKDALLFWVLQISDTIEPIKKLPYNMLSDADEIELLLKSIDIKCSTGLIEMTCTSNTISSWFHSCTSLASWTNIEVIDNGYNAVVLRIPNL